MVELRERRGTLGSWKVRCMHTQGKVLVSKTRVPVVGVMFVVI